MYPVMVASPMVRLGDLDTYSTVPIQILIEYPR